MVPLQAGVNIAAQLAYPAWERCASGEDTERVSSGARERERGDEKEGGREAGKGGRAGIGGGEGWGRERKRLRAKRWEDKKRREWDATAEWGVERCLCICSCRVGFLVGTCVACNDVWCMWDQLMNVGEHGDKLTGIQAYRHTENERVKDFLQLYPCRSAACLPTHDT